MREMHDILGVSWLEVLWLTDAHCPSSQDHHKSRLAGEFLTERLIQSSPLLQTPRQEIWLRQADEPGSTFQNV